MKYVRIYIVSWLVLVVGGFYLLNRYDFQSPRIKVEEASLVNSSMSPRAYLFLHPKCACSYASLTEFKNILPLMKGKALVKVFFTKPKGMSEETFKSDLWNEAQKIKGIQLMMDDGGEEHKKFGVTTSGEFILYNERGEKVFHGGLTPSRGHMGLSKGQIFIKEWFTGKKLARDIANVYGCGLEGKSNESRK